MSASASAEAPASRAVWRHPLTWIVVLLALPWVNIPLDNADGAGMLAHLQGFFRDFDLLYDDDYATFRMTPLFWFVTEEGVVSNHWPAGATFLQAPGYVAGLFAGALLGKTSWTLPLLALRTSAILALAAAARMVARRWGKWAALCFVLGTPALYYAAEAPTRPHLWGALVVTALVTRWMHGRDAPGLHRVAALGALAGMATAIRPQLAPLWLLAAEAAWHDGPSEERVRRFGVAVVVAVPWPALVLMMQWWMYGDLGEVVSTRETTLHVWAFLTSTYHGVLPWTPVFFVGLVGIGLGVVRRERGAVLLLALILMQVWLDAGSRPIEPGRVLGTRTWSGGTAFGPRKLLDAFPLLLPGAMWLGDAVRDPRARRALVGVALSCTLPTVLLFLAAFVDPSTTERVLDGSVYFEALGRGLSPKAWAEALRARAVPFEITATVGGLVVGLAVVFVVLAGRLAPRARSRDVGPDAGLALACLALALLAHVQLGLLKDASAAELEARPERIAAQREVTWRAHVATIRSAAGFRAQVRERLGTGAAPP